MPSSSRSKSSNRRQKHVPLTEDLAATGPLRTKSKKRKSLHDDEEKPDKGYIDSRASQKILRLGQQLQNEEQAEVKAAQPNPAFTIESRFIGGRPELESEEEVNEKDYKDEEAWGSDEDENAAGLDTEPQDLDLFHKFNPADQSDVISQVAPAAEEAGGTNLTDLILEKIAAHEAQQEGRPVIQGGGPPEDAVELPQKVIEVYTKYYPPNPPSPALSPLSQHIH